MADIAGLAKLIEPEVKSLGYELVRVAMIGGTSDPTLQVMAERPDTRQLDLSDCETISRRLSDWLDANDPIEGGFRLEVSSPGIDRPLTRLKDYRRLGRATRRASRSPNRATAASNSSGTLDGIDGDTVKLTDKDGQAPRLPFSDNLVGQAALDRQAHQRHRAAQHRGRRHHQEDRGRTSWPPHPLPSAPTRPS